MFAPEIVTAPTASPVTLDEAKSHLRVTYDDDDAMIQGFIDAAVSHLDGWDGVLGRAMVEQTWEQPFGAFSDRMLLRLTPVIEVVSVGYTDRDGVSQTVQAADYELVNWGGRGEVRTVGDAVWPEVSADVATPVSITFKAGFGTPAEVPWALKAAILMHVATLYEYRETMASSVEPTRAYEALVAPYRRVIG